MTKKVQKPKFTSATYTVQKVYNWKIIAKQTSRQNLQKPLSSLGNLAIFGISSTKIM